LDRVAVNDIGKWEASFLEHLKSSQQTLLADVSKGKMTPEIEASLRKVVVE
jgi:F-type H+-transporting ATPase subunit alpha